MDSLTGVTLRVSGDIGAPRALQMALDDILGGLVGRLLLIGERSAKSNIPKDTSAGARSIVSAQRGLMGEVSSPLLYVSVMDQGRRPGAKMPPPLALIPWIRRHGLGKEKEILSIAFLVARAIGRRGIRGKFFFAGAAEDMIRGAPDAMRQAVADIGRAWNQRG